MTERTYDPNFAVRPAPNHEGGCCFVRVSRYVEQCTHSGCPCGRISREWLDLIRPVYSSQTHEKAR